MPYEKIQIPSVSSRRSGFLYIERAKVSRKDYALSITDDMGTIEVPITTFVAVFLGSGTSVTDKAMSLLGETGVSLVWVGDGMVRFYANGAGMSKSSRLATKQAELVSNPKARASVARKMYGMRFPDEDVSEMTLQQLRGREGTRVKRIYQQAASKNGIRWNGRVTRMDSIDQDDVVNRALTMATSALYGVTHAVIVAIGALPQLGFVHSGNARSFVFDIADLYKTDLVVPLAFSMATDHKSVSVNLDLETRIEMREIIQEERLLARIVDDIKELLSFEGDIGGDVVTLWDDALGEVEAARNWAEDLR